MLEITVPYRWRPEVTLARFEILWENPNKS
jgi:hypothetical protein